MATIFRRVIILGRTGAWRLMERREGKPHFTDAGELLRQQVIESGADAVIIDPLALAHSLDENSNSEMGALIEQLQGIAREANCAMMVVHHAKTESRSGSMDAARGASALVASVRSVWMLNVAPTDSPRASDDNVVLQCAKSNNFPVRSAPTQFARGSVELDNGDSVGILIPTSSEDGRS